MATVNDALTWANEQLKAIENNKFETQLLLAHVLQCDRATLIAWPEKDLTADEMAQFENLIQRRVQHEPIAYILNLREFWSLPFYVTKDTLIPRHETELIVETVLSLLPSASQEILDLGTGCGTIACALAHERPHWQITATDVSPEAVEVAKKNVSNLGLGNIIILLSNWFDAIQNIQFDAIVSNPPYIRENYLSMIHGDLPHEPRIALTPGPSGLEAFKIILGQCKKYLKPKGLIAFEHGFDQAESLSALLSEAGFKDIKTYYDAAGLARVTVGYI